MILSKVYSFHMATAQAFPTPAPREPDAWNPAAREGALRPLGPGSVTWEVFGDVVFPLGASRRLLIDVAHPLVAAGVRDFSVFDTDPYGRAERTLELIMGVVYGEQDALAAAQRLREGHQRFRGTTPDGTRWSALDPEAFHWVHASMVDGIWTQQALLGRGWRPGEAERFYDEMREVGRLYGLRDRDMPADWAAFRAWWEEMLEDRCERNDVTDRLLHLIRHPSAPPVPVLRARPVWAPISAAGGRLNALLTAGLVPPRLREKLGIPWDERRRRAFDAHAAILRRTIPRLPARLRTLPYPYAAARRATRVA